MATLTNKTIASSYPQLLSLPDGGGNGTTLVAITDGDAGNTFALQLATDKVQVVGELNIDQDATSGTAINIDTETQDGQGIYMDVSQQTSGYGININDVGNSRTTGGVLYINSNQNNSGTRNLVEFRNMHANATGTTALKIQQESTGLAINALGNVSIGDTTIPRLAAVSSLFDGALRLAHTGADGDIALFEMEGKKSGADADVCVMSFNNADSDDTYKRLAEIRVGRVGADNSGQFSFRTDNAGSFATRMTITSAGNVGIGTTSPSRELSVVSSSSKGGMSVEAANIPSIYLTDNHANVSRRQYVITSNFVEFGDFGIKQSSNATADPHDGTTRFYINNAGAVGIGTASPTHAKMEIVGDSDAFQLTMSDVADSDDTTKEARMGMLHYKQAEEPVTLFYAQSGSTANAIYIGGGTGVGNAATSVGIVTGANYNTASGTTRMLVDNNSRISLSNNDSGTGNTVFGHLAGDDLASGGNYNTFIGQNAGHENKLGDQNIAIGYQAMDASYIDDTQDAATVQNVFIGNNAGGGNWVTAACHSNTAIGAGVMAGAMNGATNNTAVGLVSSAAITTGDFNSGLGGYSNYNITTGEGNTSIGYSANLYNETGTYNTFLGTQAGQGATGQSHNGNVGIGYKGLYAITSGAYNTTLGYQTGINLTTGGANIAIGTDAMSVPTNPETSIAIGQNAMGSLQAGQAFTDVIAIGLNAVRGSSSSTDAINGSIGIGQDALRNITSGAGNTAIGYQAMDANTTGSQNTAVGYNAAGAIPGGAFGNTAIGYNALANGNNEATDENTCIGHLAGDLITSGENNVIIGAGADVGTNTDSNCIVIGREAIGQGTNKIVLGNSAHTDVYMASDSGATVHCAGIDFSASQPAPDAGSSSSEVLDSYEEGTWTPVLNGSTNGAAVNYDTQFGAYTKIGRMVHVTCHIAMTNFNNSGGAAISGDLTITGLPFTSSNTNDAYTNGIVRYGDFALPTSTDNSATVAPTVFASTNKNSASIGLKLYDNSSSNTNLQASEMSSDGDILFDVTYFV